MSETYKVHKNMLGKYQVHYQCPKCQENLVNAIKEAGGQDNCPNCQARFVIPGSEAKQKLAAEKADAETTRHKKVGAMPAATGVGLIAYLVLPAVFLGIGGYYVGRGSTNADKVALRTKLTSLEANHERLLSDWRSVEQSIEESKRKVKQLENENKTLTDEFSQRETKSNSEWEARVERERAIAIGAYIERWRNYYLKVAVGGLSEQEDAKFGEYLARLESGRKLSGSEYLWVSGKLNANVNVTPYHMALMVDWSDMPEIKTKIDRILGSQLGLETDELFAQKLSDCSNDEDRWILIHDRESLITSVEE